MEREGQQDKLHNLQTKRRVAASSKVVGWSESDRCIRARFEVWYKTNGQFLYVELIPGFTQGLNQAF
jgi:hypothetical protein